MKNRTLALSVEEHLKSYQPYKTMKEFIVAKDHLPVKHVEKVSGKGYHTLYTGNIHRIK
jgi:hypothetical protein